MQAYPDHGEAAKEGDFIIWKPARLVTDSGPIRSMIDLHGRDHASLNKTAYYSTDAVRSRRAYAGVVLVGLILISTLLDKLIYPITYFPADLIKHTVESVILPLVLDDPIKYLVANGNVRRATISDINEWERASTKNSYSGRLASHRSEHLREVDAYVVLENIRMPGGMYGANSGTFIIPKGVAKPRDLGSHNSYFFVENGTFSD